jgi:hypothetical protein
MNLNMADQDLDRFQQLVLRDPALQAQLRVERDMASFVALVVRAGEARGYFFTPEDVRAAMQANQRAWLERWIQ